MKQLERQQHENRSAFGIEHARHWIAAGVLFAAAAGPSLAQVSLQVFPSSDPFSEAGRSVAVGDIDGNGVPEVLIGEPGFNLGSGRVSVYTGGSFGVQVLFLGAPMLPSGPGSGPGGGFGESIAVSDLNNDGFGDIIVGAPGEAAQGQFHVGTAYVFDGKASVTQGAWVTLFPTKMLGSGAPLISGGDDFGAAVVACGDVNGDGSPDFAVGAPLGTPVNSGKTGYVDVFPGATGLRLWKVNPCQGSPLRSFGRRLARGNFYGTNDGPAFRASIRRAAPCAAPAKSR